MTLLAGLVLLGIARLFPQHGFGLWLRLAAATLVLLAPGRMVARTLGLRSWAAAFTWSVALVAGALALTFAVHASLTLTLVLVLAAGAAALAARFRSGRSRSTALHRPAPATRLNAGCAVAGIGLGIALWSIEGLVKGDALFHLGRVRKLNDFGSLSLRAVDEFKDGGLHPGYAFPLWHGWLALIAQPRRRRSDLGRAARVEPARAARTRARARDGAAGVPIGVARVRSRCSRRSA